MRIKMGQHWFDVMPNMPLMIEFTERDRANIAAMLPDCTRYAVFHEDDRRTPKERSAWMDAGATGVVEPHRPRRSRNGKGSDNPAGAAQLPPLEKKP